MRELALSVIIPTYNRAPLVARAIGSALASCRASDEVIVVDDGSTDATEAVVRSFGDRVTYLRSSNGGAGRARNIGVSVATRPLVAFLDSDDEWIPGELEWRRGILEARDDVLFCFSDFLVREEDGADHHRYLVNWNDDRRPWDEILGPGTPLGALVPGAAGRADGTVYIGSIYEAEMAASYISTITVVARRAAAPRALWFAEDLATYEDWECFGRLAGAGAAAFLDRETAINHGHAGARLTDADSLVTSTARITLLERVWGADTGYLATHGDAYRDVLQSMHERRVRGLLSAGLTRDARQEIRRAEAVPFRYRLLSWLPRIVLLAVIAAYSLVSLLTGNDII